MDSKNLETYCKFVSHPRRGKTYYICTVCEQEQRHYGAIENLKRPCPGYSMPNFTKQAWNLGSAIKDFVAEPDTVSKDTYEKRISKCNDCEYRVNQRCALCGCWILMKAASQAQHCPDARWDGDTLDHKITPNIAIAIITAPREQPTLERTIKSIREAGYQYEPIFIFAEPGVERYIADNVVTFTHQTKLGHFANYKNSLRWMRDNTPHDLVLMCEDDVEFAKDSKSYVTHGLKTIGTKDIGYFSLYTPVHNANLIADKVIGWNEANLYDHAWGALAYLVPKDSLINVEQMPGSCADRDFTVWLNRQNLKTYHHLPSLAKHIGITSTLRHERKEGSEPYEMQPDSQS